MNEITKPTLLLDEQKCRANIRRMGAKCIANGLRLRPHFKTHQSDQVGSWIEDQGITHCTASSVSMASYFVDAGWKDVTIAFPVNPREWKAICAMQEKAQINIIIASPHILPFLKDNPPSRSMGVYIKIDVGTRRTGFRPVEERQIASVLEVLASSDLYTFKGFLSHAGHAYACRSDIELQTVHDQALAIFSGLRSRFSAHEPFEVSLGDTPTASVAEGWDGVDEIRAGNFVFYDVMQWQIGACQMEDIAVCLACPVVAKHDDRKSIIIYGGGIHLSKDRITWNNKTIYGFPVLLDEKTLQWQMPDEESYVSAISQEHGVISATQALYDQIEVGQLVGILPVHSCMTADLMKEYQVANQGKVSMLQYI